MKPWFALCAAVWFAATTAYPAGLQPQTAEAFDRYAKQTEQRLDARQSFLWVDESSARAARVRKGEIVVEPLRGSGQQAVPGGLIHDWVGTVFIPGVTLEKTIGLVQDYSHHKEYYRPEVADSRILSHDGNDFKIYLRLVKKKVITVVLDTEHEVHYYPIDATHWRSVSRSTKVAEVAGAGKPGEHELKSGEDHGFLWALNSYWRFEERGGGTWVECEAVSLTRAVPAGLSWIVDPVIRDLPRQSLANTLQETRSALSK
ncbi:MAG TPA: hypothetical protein VG675_06105 [Bryobacteraceae bacterium]|nr:hypothetical protein [Bryobacteraceae bacterium]